jgi:hypothetical protein
MARPALPPKIKGMTYPWSVCGVPMKIFWTDDRRQSAPDPVVKKKMLLRFIL